MKKSNTLKRFLSVLLMIAMLMPTIVQPLSAIADDRGALSPVVNSGQTWKETDWIEEHLVAITVGGIKYDPKNAPIDYQEGTNISVRFDWKIKNGQQIPEEYEYSLGDYKLKADYNGSLLLDQLGRSIGEWAVVRDTDSGEDKLVFTFDDWFRSEYTIERYFWLQLDGTVPLDPPGTGNSDKNRFAIGEEWLDLNPKYQQGGVDLSKEMKDLKLDTDGHLLYTANITATVKGYIEDLVLFDQLSEDVAPPASSGFYSMDNLAVKVNEKNLDKAEYTVIDYNQQSGSRPNTGRAGKWGFELSFNDMVFNAGDKITVTYTFKMTYSVLGNPNYFPEYNTIDAECTDIPTGGKITCTPKNAPVNLGDLELTLKKSGDRDTTDPSLIKWTLTIDTGIAAPAGTTMPSDAATNSQIRQAIINLLKKKYPNLNLYEVLGAGHDFTNEFINIKNLNGNSGYFTGGFLLDPKITKFVVNDDDEWSIVCEYTTQIKNVAGISEYTNTATIRDNTTDIATSDPVGLPVYTLDKTAINAEPTVNMENGEVTMPWQIVTRIPGPGFGSYTIVDNPENDNNGYTHRYKKDSVKVYVSDKLNSKGSPLADWPTWLKFEEYGNGFKLTVSEDKAYVHKYLFLVFDTEVVDAQGNNVDFTDGNYQWKNTTVIDGKDIEDSATYAPISKESAAPTIAKGAITNVVDEANGDYVFTWLVSVNNIPVLARNSGVWTESLDDVFSIELKDTLPEGHVFEQGSLAATLYKGSGTSISSKNVISSESIPEISEWLSNNLIYEIIGVNDKGQEEVKISWSTPDGQFPSVKELEALSSATTENYYLAIEYKTRLVDHAVLVNGTTTFKNDAGGKVNDKDVVGANASAQVKPGNFGAKTYDYKSDWISAEYPDETDWMYTVGENGAACPNMRFTIEINQPALTASTDDRGIVYLEDTMGSDLRLIEESVRLYNTTTKQYEEVSFEYSDNKLTLQVPGGTHYTLTYWVEVCGNVGSTVSSSKHGNKVKLTLEGVSKEYTKNPSGKKYGSAAGAHAAAFSFIIQKTDAQTQETLSGANFTLEYGAFNADGRFEKYTLNDDEGVVASADPDGRYYAFKSADQLDYVFRITETKAPDDYLIGAARYVVFTDYYSGDLSKLPDFVEKYDLGRGIYCFPDEHIFAAASFEGTKQLYRRRWDNDKDNGAYTFTLEAVTAGAPMPETTVVTNDGHDIRFPQIKYMQAGTYKYKITETAVDTSKVTGVSKDPNPVYVTVKVVKDSKSPTGMTATVRYSSNENASFEAGKESFTFVNSYNDAEVTVKLYAAKRLETGGFGANGEYTFEFVLSPDANNPSGDPVTGSITKSVTVKNPSYSGTTANFFDGLAFKKEGTYTYTLTEMKPVDADKLYNGVTYSTAVYTVVVNIDLNEDKTELVYTVTLNGKEGDTATFVNSYTAKETTADLTVSKIFNNNGFGIKNDYTFDFVLTPNDDNPVDDPVTDAITKSVTLVAPDLSGSTENFFAGLSFTKEGIYTYTLTETNNSVIGVDYDETVYTVTVEITLNEAEAKLESTVKVDGEVSSNTSFGNSYKAQETSIVLEGKKTLVNGDLKENEFIFVLEAVTDAAPMPTATEVANGADGIFLFDAITYSSAGVYMYTITEKRGTEKGIIYDETVYDVTVTVTLDEEKAELTASVKYQVRDGEEAQRADFVNTFLNSDDGNSVGGDKDGNSYGTDGDNDDNDDSVTTDNNSNVQSGDNVNVMLPLSIMVIAIAVIAIRKKEEE